MALKMKNIVSFMIMMEILYRAAGVLTNKTNTPVCKGLTANIDFTIDLQGSTVGTGSASWYFGSTLIATNSGGSFTPEGNYSSRLSSYLTYGVSLTNVTKADEGEYSLMLTVILPVYEDVTANASLTVNVAPASSCVPYNSLTGNTGRCVLNQTAISNNECGSPVLQTNWTNGLGTSDITNIATSGNYTCCAYGIARNCYSGSYTFCETFSITVSTTTSTTPTTTTEMSTAQTSTTMSNTTESEDNKNNTSPTSTTTSDINEGGKDDKQIIIISVSVSGGIIVLGVPVIIIICCRRGPKKAVDEVVDMKYRHGTPNLEGNDVTDSNPNKGISSAQIRLSMHTSVSPQDGKDKPFAKEIKEAEHVKQEITNP